MKHPYKKPRPGMLRRVQVFAALAVLLALVLAGCQSDESTDPSPAAPTVSKTMPSVTPSPTCTDPPGPCSDYDYEQEQLFEEAKARYMEYLKLFAEVDEAGGASPAPEWLDEYTAEGYKEIHVAGFVAALKSDFKPEPNALKKMKLSIYKLRERLKDGAEIGLRVCSDARAVKAIDKKTGEVVGHGTLTEQKLHFKRIGGKLKIIRGFEEEVKSCEAT